MTRRSKRPRAGETAFGTLGALAIAVAICAGCRPAERASTASPPAVASKPESRARQMRIPTPTAIAIGESSATYEVPIGAEAPEPAAGEAAEPAVEPRERPDPGPIVAERPADTPARCLLLQVAPSSTSAYGLRGEVAQVVVRAQNGCGTSFDGAAFRVTAIGSAGEIASARGRFSGTIPPGGSAETLLAVPTKPSVSLTYRAEVLGY